MTSNSQSDYVHVSSNTAVEMQEPILRANPDRFVLYPIEYPKIWQMYKTAQANFWTTEEIDLSTDLTHWNADLTAEERAFISTILAFFAVSHGIVSENLVQRLCTEVQIAEVRCFYGFQMMMKNVHSETYSLLLGSLITDNTERNNLLKAADTVPCIKAKAEWCFKWLDDVDEPFAARLVVFAAVEAIFYSSSFAAIFWLRTKGVLPGVSFSNVLIARDEGLHADFACVLYGHLQAIISEEAVHNIISDAVRLEKEYFHDALPCPLIGISAEAMDVYIEYIADRLLGALGYTPLYLSANPFPFMENIYLDERTNFVERRVTYYKSTGVSFPSTVTSLSPSPSMPSLEDVSSDESD